MRNDLLDRLRPRLHALVVSFGAPATMSESGAQARRLRPSNIALAAIGAFFWIAFSIGLRPLSLPEEGRYVGVAWEMLRSGDWLVPTEDGLPFFHKPPLFYWITAGAMRLFSINEWAARVAPLLAATLGAITLYAVGRRWAGDRAARWAALILVTEPFFFAASQFANLDMLVAACIAVAITLAGHAALLVRRGEPHRAALLGAWAALAFGVLAKGLIGIVLPGLVVLVWLATTGQSRTILRLLWPAGILLFAIICAPWFAAVQMRHSGFAHFFFVYQHFERFTATGFNNVQPWWFFIVAVPALTLPWSLALLGSTFKARSGEPAEATLWRRLMWTWLVVVLAFFSIPQSKPVGYAMPVLFPIAALVADAIVARFEAGKRRVRGVAFACAALAVLVCLAAVLYMRFAYHRDNTAIGHELARLRSPADPVVFVGEYFFDVPLHARLREPVPVTGNWADPGIMRRDNWRRELHEGAPFAPELAATLLIDTDRGLALRCGAAPLWVVVKSDGEGRVAALPGATLALTSNRVSLWRVAPADCAATTMPKAPSP